MDCNRFRRPAFPGFRAVEAPAKLPAKEGSAMPRTFATFTLPLLAAFLLALPLLPGRVVAGPPVRVSGVMVFDKVADGLRKYRSAKNEDIAWTYFMRLATIRDPRVLVLLGEEWESQKRWSSWAAVWLVNYHFDPKEQKAGIDLDAWWENNKADLHRRAKQLPQ
jgi:hypothetical protein